MMEGYTGESAPYFISNFFYKSNFFPLVSFCQNIAFFCGGKSALCAQAESVQGNITGGLLNAGFNGSFVFQTGLFGGDQSQYNDLGRGIRIAGGQSRRNGHRQIPDSRH